MGVCKTAENRETLPPNFLSFYNKEDLGGSVRVIININIPQLLEQLQPI
jgi:hypothetical protein